MAEIATEITEMSDNKARVFQMRTDDEFLTQLDDLRRNDPELPPRAEMMRKLVKAEHAKLMKKKAAKK